MSLRWQFLGAFILIITVAVLLSAGLSYFSTQERLDSFVAEIRIDETNQLAQNLSQGYTLTGSWESLGLTLAEAGYFYDEGDLESKSENDKEGEGGEGGEEEGDEFFHQDAVRVVIVDIEDYVIHDNFFELDPGEHALAVDGQRATISNLHTDQPVGYVFMDVNHVLFGNE